MSPSSSEGSFTAEGLPKWDQVVDAQREPKMPQNQPSKCAQKPTILLPILNPLASQAGRSVNMTGRTELLLKTELEVMTLDVGERRHFWGIFGQAENDHLHSLFESAQKRKGTKVSSSRSAD